MNEQMQIQAQVDKAKVEAQELHCRIMATGSVLASALVEFSRELKEMRDRKLYQALGYAEFEEYVEGAVGLKVRQAYNYIGTYERLGPKLMGDQAGLGITKLQLLAEISAPDRAEFASQNELAGMSVAEIKALVQKANDQGQQLSMLEAELADAEGCEKTYKAEAERLAEEMERVKAEAAAKARKEAETLAEKTLKEERAKLRRELEAKQGQGLAAKLKKAREEGEEKARKEAKDEADRERARMEAEKKDAEQRAQELAKQLELAASRESTAFAVYFDQLQAAFAKMMEQAGALAEQGKTAEADKLRAALAKALRALAERV